jgi:hypothetical protein
MKEKIRKEIEEIGKNGMSKWEWVLLRGGVDINGKKKFLSFFLF